MFVIVVSAEFTYAIKEIEQMKCVTAYIKCMLRTSWLLWF